MKIESWRENPKLLGSVAKRTQSDNANRQAEAKAHLRLYWDRQNYENVEWSRRGREMGIYDRMRKSYGCNLTREVVDAAAAIICREMRAELSPMGADFELDQGCKEATRLIEGVADNSDFLSIATRAFRDGAVADVGPVKGYVDPETNQIKFERVDPLSLTWVDDGTDNPRTFIETTPVPRDQLAARFPKFRKEIMDAASWSPQSVPGVDLYGKKEADTVMLVEGHCRTIGSSKGRHAMVLGQSDVVLFQEAWEHDITPIFSFKWSDDYRGYGGLSLARIVAPYDIANRRLDRMIYKSLGGALPIIVHHEDDDVKMTDIEYQKWPWKMSEPKVYLPNVVSPEIIRQKEDNRARAFAEGGVNQNMATGSTSARFESGAAQREYVDIASTRLMLAQKQWEKFWKQFARVVVMLAQQAKTAHVRIQGVNHYKKVSFPSLRKDSFRISFGLASGLGLTPAARKQEIADLRAAVPTLFDEADAIRALGQSDTRAISDRVNAPRDLIMSQISQALDEGIFPMPNRTQDMAAIIRLATQERDRAELQGTYPPGHMECLRRYIRAAEKLMPPATPPAAKPQPDPIPVTVVGPGAPGAGPVGAPPVAPAAPAAPVAA